MKRSVLFLICALVVPALFLMSCGNEPSAPVEAASSPAVLLSKGPTPPAGSISVSVFATGLNFPRGLKFGPDGYLYVAEAGAGGNTPAQGSLQVAPPIGPYTGGYTARISKISPSGLRSTVVDGLPSAMNAMGDVLGVADVEFRGRRMYALLAGGGSSHAFPDVPASVLRVGTNGAWTVIADLSYFQQNHPVANSEEEDFEPDGAWYSMVRAGDDLYAVEPNHGELDRVDLKSGSIKRIVDISASQGHIVPTAIVYHRGHFYVGNLGVFPITPGSAKILRISKSGKISTWATGFTTILGLALDRKDRMYVLETTTDPGFPSPGTGRVVRINKKGGNETIADGLFLPTAMTIGPDGNLYVSNKGFGPPIPGFGEILKIDLPDSHGPKGEGEGDGD